MTAFVSLEETQVAARTVYGGDQGELMLPTGWQLDTSFNNGTGDAGASAGGYVYALKPAGTDDGRRMLVFRGTEVTLTNVKDVFADVTDIGKTQFSELRNAVNQWLAQELVAGHQVELVGHSSGGALVQWAINDTNMRDTTDPNFSSVLERARLLPDPNDPDGLPNTSFQINPSQLHFTTFNAPGITHVLGGSSPVTDRTSVVVGEHHVVIGQPPIVQGDPIHLLGGPQIGALGTQVLGHLVSFATVGEGWFTHTIRKPEYWTAPVVPYTPLQLDLALAQSFASHYAQLGNTDGTVQGNTEAALRLALYASAMGVSLGVGVLGNQAAAAAQLAGLQFDRDVFADTLALPGVGINRALEMITRAADAAGQNVAQVQGLVSSALIEVGRMLTGAVGTVDAFVTGTLLPWITNTAQGIANAFSEFIADIPGAFDLGRTLGFVEYGTYRNAYEQALQDQTIDPALNAALESAKTTLDQAGQTLVIQPGFSANPFNATGFNPEAAPPAAVNMNEGQLKALTINLPFEAGPGGQKLSLTLSGPNASGFVLRTNGTDLLPQGNAFTLTIPEGQRQLVVGLKSTQDIAANTALTVSATLVDAAGQPTHTTQVEATVAVADTGALFDGTVPTIDYGANGFATEEILLPQTGSWIMERVEAKNYIFQGGQGSYRIYAGPGNDQLYGGPNFDRLSSRGGNDLLQAFGGNDELYGWEDNDVLEGGDGDDQLYGDLALEQAGQDYLDGGAGDDMLVGGSEDDVLVGGSGNDTLWGEGGTTELTIIPPGDPVNTGFSFTMDRALGLGDDTLDGGAGDDTIIGSGGADTLFGGDGIDVLYGDHTGGETLVPWDPAKDGEDYLDGGAGNDWLYGGGRADVLMGGSGDDMLFGEGVLYAAPAGDDWLEGGDGNDQLYGGLGADALFGGIGDDVLVGDYANESGADDMLDGGVGIDELQGGGGNDLLIGGSENDRLFGQDGDDDLSGDAGDDELQGGLGDDALFGGTGNDFLLGQEGEDFLDGEEGDDLIKGADGNDTLFGGDGIDELQGGTGDDQLAGDAGDDFLLGEAGNDTLFGDEGADRLQGGIGDDLIAGDAGNDGLFGEDGADQLFGDEGNDELFGGIGNDILTGGTGSDKYLFIPGDGQDQILEEDVVGEVNTILFDPIITREMLSFTHNTIDNTLLIQVGASSDSILIHGFTNTGVNGTGGIQNIVAGGQTFALADLLGLPSGQIIGTSENDVIRTGVGNDTIFAGGGNDTITGNAGNDVLRGGSGHDLYTFALGDGLDTIHDTVTTTEGNRIVFGPGVTAANLTYTQGANTLTIGYNGGADAVQLAGFNRNTVLGSLVVSTLQLADGTLVNLGDLFPVFTNHAPTVTNAVPDQTVPEDAPWTFAVPANTFADEDLGDVLTLSARLADGSALPAWLSFDAQTGTFSGTPDDAQIGMLGLKVTATDGLNGTVSESFNLTITNVNDAPTVATPLPDQSATKDVPFSLVVPTGTFADVDPGDSLVYSATLSDNSPLPTWLQFNPTTRTFTGTPQLADVGTLNVKVTATDTGSLNVSDVFALTVSHGLNEILGTAASETLTGTAGNDLIRGLGGNDTLQGLDGNDTLEGGDGDDQLSGGTGDNTLDGGAGSDRLIVVAATGTNVLIGGSGGDRLEGSAGTDTLQGGTGNDEISDSGGQNLILFDRGDGQDTIYAPTGTIRFGTSVLPTDVTVRGVSTNYSLVLSINGTADNMSLFNWLNPFNDYRINRVEFSNGMVWDSSMLRSLASTGTVADDYLGGTNADEILSGMGGNDLIEAWDGNDVLDGGTGNDTLRGGLGNDTYLFGRGAGSDLIGDDGGTTDKIQLTPGVLPGDVTLLRNGTELLLSIDQSPTQLRMNNATAIEQITFNDGTIWDAAAIVSHTFIGTVNSQTGTAGNDTFVVDNTQDTVTEGISQGTDTIQSLVSYTLPGNVENLTLTGYYNVDGTGNLLDNVIIGNSGNNKLVGGGNSVNDGGSDILQGGLGDDNYEVIGTDTVIEASNEGIDTVKFLGTWDFGMHYTLPDNVENLIVWDGPPVQGLVVHNLSGNALNNVIVGNQHWYNYIDGGLGADTMIGGNASDTYVVDNLGDTVSDVGFATDTVLSSVSFTLGANLENLTLTGTATSNGTGNELNNVLTGNSAANVLTGGAGNDTYVIGAGDTIVELAGQGIDTINTDQSFVLSAELEDVLENVTLTGTEAINATGNAGDNVLTGNSGNNVLDGGGGIDQLIGGTGDDTYVVGAGDTIVEQQFGGTDTVITDQTFTLGSELENLTLTGTAAINGTGNELDNVLTGNSGANVLIGGTGNDTYVVDDADTIVELPGEGWADTVVASTSWTLAADLENLTLTGTGAINGTGNAQDNVLTGNSGANVLTGGAGDDTYIVDGGDTIVELANQGTDQVMSSATFMLGANVEYLTLTGTDAINGTGNALDNILSGNAGANMLDGGVGADWMMGYSGNDTYVIDHVGDTVEEEAAEGIDTVQSSLTYTLGANIENLTLTGSSAINGTGNALSNVLTGNSAANVLTGGAGNDTYVVGTGDTVTESSGQGTDTVQSSVTWTLGANLENLTLTGTAAINGTGNTLNNTLVGNSGANVLSGGTGADAMSGGAGDDTYVLDNAGDTVTENANEGVDTVQSALTYTLGANVENLTLMGTTAINGTGNALDNVLTGNSAANMLTGGAGNDTYVVGTGDTVTEAAGAGTDTVQSFITWTLGNNLENLTLTGSSAINGTGNTLNNVLTGNSGLNTLNGGAGADTMAGGAGNDTYVVDNVGDVITENVGGGTDLVQSAVTYALGAEVENLTLTGALAINGTGNALNNSLTGNTGNNMLDGGAGADAMSGGTGNDTYIVDNAGDTVTEAASAGTDTVQSAVTFTLGANIENLTLTGSAAINATGNTLNNTLVGNSGANVLNGGTGADGMSGGAGDDTYVRDNAGDTVTENTNEGLDTVQSSLTYTLGANVENLTLTGTTAINGTGNALDNILTGNSAANVLTGGAGNDTYVVGTGDTVTELANAGIDTVQSSLTYTLGANVENLTLTGTTAINGTGNALDNLLMGNSAANVLTGGAGNDTYIVGTGDTVTEAASAGTDTVQSAVAWTLGANLENLTLIGTAAVNGTGNTANNILAGNSANNMLSGLGGNDTYLYSRGGGQDTVSDNSGTADVLAFGVTINPLDLVLTRQVNDLRLAIHGSTDSVTIQNWYTSPTTNQLEDLQAGNGQHLANTKVDQLIQAMAAFGQQTGLTWDQAIDQRPQDVQTILAANWQ
ncbi:MAG: putative Ig domain-containing protein [Nitrospira sp.]|nr:putative Ig domain-containing protein [Nitrospira sp.]